MLNLTVIESGKGRRGNVQRISFTNPTLTPVILPRCVFPNSYLLRLIQHFIGKVERALISSRICDGNAPSSNASCPVPQEEEEYGISMGAVWFDRHSPDRTLVLIAALTESSPVLTVITSAGSEAKQQDCQAHRAT